MTTIHRLSIIKNKTIHMDFNETILIKFLNGECDTEELRALDDWLDADSENAATLFRLESLHRQVGAATMSAREVTQHLNKLHRRTNARRPQRTANLRTWLRRAAIMTGVIVLGALAFWLTGANSPLRSTKMLTATATGDHPRMVRLTDGTMVWLKAGSLLRYPQTFNGRERRVELCGEAYFEVTKNRHLPFVVDGDSVEVQVLGTKFDFSVNDNKHSASVSLIEGTVEVKDVEREARLLLKPRQRVMINTKTGQQHVEDMDTRIVAAWHNRLVPFVNANVNDIARTLEELYGIRVHVASSTDVTSTFSGAVSLTNDIDSVLNLIKSTVPIRYHRKGNTVWIEAE